MSRVDIANFLDIRVETLSRTLNGLQRDRFLKVGGSTIELCAVPNAGFRVLDPPH
jgi:CRP-like cAMP-binding protein